MNKYIKLIPILSMVFILGSCTKQTIGPMMDIKPTIPVTVSNAIDFRPDPTVSTSKSAGGAIQIILSIPEGLGRTIKEITKVSASTSYSLVQSASGAYNAAPIPGTGTRSITFNTSLTEYVAKAAGVIPAANSELAKRFFFIVTLDDNQQIVTEATRVLVLN